MNKVVRSAGATPSASLAFPDGGEVVANPDGAALHIVMATSGEWSDRSEWPVGYTANEDDAKAWVERLSAATREAWSSPPEEPEGGFDYELGDDPVWTAYWLARDAWERAAIASLEALGAYVTDSDTTFFIYTVKPLAPLDGHATTPPRDGEAPATEPKSSEPEGRE